MVEILRLGRTVHRIVSLEYIQRTRCVERAAIVLPSTQNSPSGRAMTKPAEAWTPTKTSARPVRRRSGQKLPVHTPFEPCSWCAVRICNYHKALTRRDSFLVQL